MNKILLGLVLLICCQITNSNASELGDSLIRKQEKISPKDKIFQQLILETEWKQILKDYEHLIDLNKANKYHSNYSLVETLIIPFKSKIDENKNITVYISPKKEYLILLSETQKLDNGGLIFSQFNFRESRTNSLFISQNGEITKTKENYVNFSFSKEKILSDTSILTHEEILNKIREETDLSDEEITEGKEEVERQVAANCTSLPFVECVACSSSACSRSWTCELFCAAIGQSSCLAIIGAACVKPMLNNH